MIKTVAAAFQLALLCVAVGLLASSTARGQATISIQIDPSDTGFNDSTPVAPIGGNSGTTVGQQRMNAFQFAANIWGATLASGPTIVVNAKWIALECDAESAVLGSAGTPTIHADFPNAGFPDTWYGASLANALSGNDRNGATPEINAQFNVNLGKTDCLEGSFWYLGFDGAHGGGIDLVTVLLHEFSHGLGMQTFTTISTGALNGGTPSLYDRFLRDNTSGKLWTQMTNAERAASATNNGNLVWAGNNVTADAPNVLGTPLLRINSPSVATLSIGTADFGPSLSSPGVTANVVRALDLADGAGPSTTDGCSSFTNAASVNGNIAFIDRGTCNFIDKVRNAQLAGAVAVIVGNVATSPNANSTQIMGSAGPPVLISIPSVHLALTDANNLRNQLNSTTPNASITLNHSVLLGADTSNRVRIYAPTSLEGGSSVSHFDVVAYPNLLMEPDNSGDLSHSVAPPQALTLSLFRDLGWTTGAGSSASVQLSSTTFSANENVGSMTVNVTRTGDTAGAASVNYTTSDSAGLNSCNQVTGAASARCDYIQTLGTLSFAAGETSKSILIPIVDDSYNEGSETFTITLSSPSGATLGTSTATLTINDGGTESGGNPIDNVSFFVRQHYIDFLNREPDTTGFNFWIGEINSCGANASCIDVKRVNVSAAFFLSIEFQETGYLVYRVYKTAFSNLTTPPGAPVPIVLSDFLRDTQQIGRGVQVKVGNWEAQLEANKQAYTLAFVQRGDFLAAYPTTMSAADFVLQLNNRAGGVLSPTEQTNLINQLAPDPANSTLRSQVLRAVAEDDELKTAEKRKAFVLMQYFGYLRRNPNDFPQIGLNFDGFNFWLEKLNQFNGDFAAAEMVKAFITSDEYKRRFGPTN
jgi:Calx-beta domain/PA domain